jgi:glycosyltransferase involved in cell wall biosynthesis
VRRTEEALGIEVPIVRATKENLRDVLERLVADPEERRRIGAASRAYVERVHDADRMADRLIEIYGRL